MAARANHFLDNRLLPILRSETAQNGHVVAVVSHGIILATLWRCFLRRFSKYTVTVAPESHVAHNGTVLEYLGGWSNTGYLELQIDRAELSNFENITSETPQVNTVQPVPTSLAVSPTAIGEFEVEPLTTGTSLVSPDTERDQLRAEEAPATIAELEGLPGWNMIVQTVNGKDHLKGLKRTGGGVGSSQFDEGQRKIETFFKKQKIA